MEQYKTTDDLPSNYNQYTLYNYNQKTEQSMNVILPVYFIFHSQMEQTISVLLFSTRV